MLDFLSVAAQMVAVILMSMAIIGFIAPPLKRAIDALENAPRRK